jgi:hypothetical protein
VTRLAATSDAIPDHPVQGSSLRQQRRLNGEPDDERAENDEGQNAVNAQEDRERMLLPGFVIDRVLKLGSVEFQVG